jgi:hypothetical protein
MSPPSFVAKRSELRNILRDTYDQRQKITFSLRKRDVEAAKPTALCQPISLESNKGKRDILKSKSIDKDHVLFKFALLRYDELGELALISGRN